jgi:hypothetical protein
MFILTNIKIDNCFGGRIDLLKIHNEHVWDDLVKLSTQINDKKYYEKPMFILRDICSMHLNRYTGKKFYKFKETSLYTIYFSIKEKIRDGKNTLSFFLEEVEKLGDVTSSEHIYTETNEFYLK